jgi:hypothetical protein
MEGRVGELAVIKGSGGGHPRRMSARVVSTREHGSCEVKKDKKKS